MFGAETVRGELGWRAGAGQVQVRGLWVRDRSGQNFLNSCECGAGAEKISTRAGL